MVKGKTSSSQPNIDEVSDEENLEIEGNDDGKDQSLSCPHVLQLPLVRALNLQATNAELDTPPKTSENQVFSESENQISNLKPNSAVVPISLSNSKLALIEIQPSLDSEKSLIMNGGVLDNNNSEENINFGFYPKPKGLEKSLRVTNQG